MTSRLKEHLIMWPALFVLGTALFGLLYSIHSYLPKEVMYDCRLAEISPDIPLSVKQQCRKIRMEQK
jgi:hypothetical protein